MTKCYLNSHPVSLFFPVLFLVLRTVLTLSAAVTADAATSLPPYDTHAVTWHNNDDGYTTEAHETTTQRYDSDTTQATHNTSHDTTQHPGISTTTEVDSIITADVVASVTRGRVGNSSEGASGDHQRTPGNRWTVLPWNVGVLSAKLVPPPINSVYKGYGKDRRKSEGPLDGREHWKQGSHREGPFANINIDNKKDLVANRDRNYGNSIDEENVTAFKSLSLLRNHLDVFNTNRNRDIHLDHSDLYNWKKSLLKTFVTVKPYKTVENILYKPSSLQFDLSSQVWDSSSKLSVSTDDLDFELGSTPNTLLGDKSAEIRDLALKKWLKSSSKLLSSSEDEQRTIAELSYKILSQIDPEEESKDEAHDKEIFKAVVTSVAAYQIRRLQKKLRK